jgi:hypothetical protein
MTEKKQILDVTYGTFSCRLEGFDDSLDTLKKVAGFFHKMASEKPTFDTSADPQTLAALAVLTRDASHHEVEAIQSEGRLSLRQRVSEVIETATEDDDETAETIAEMDTDTIVAKLRRIRDAVADEEDEEETPSASVEVAPAPLRRVNPLASRLAAIAERNAADAEAPQEDEDEIDPQELADLASLDGAKIDTEGMPLAELVQDDDLNLRDEMAEIERDIEERNKRQDLMRDSDAAISRIMQETDSHLNAPEFRRQQDNFVQLKAAAIATDAARQLGDEVAIKQRLSDIFRSDLGAISQENDQSWRDLPDDDADDFDEVTATSDLDDADDWQEPEDQDTAPEEVAERPAQAETRPISPLPPLRLVASQRIILPSQPAADSASARLRQIAAQQASDEAAKPDSFDAFAARHGATTMDELVVAAAAYLTRVRDAESFSRPQIMGMMRRAFGADFTRHAGLQSFAKALSDGKIIKRDDGRFVTADSVTMGARDKAARG